jgi:hypothetical protein
MSIHRIGVQLGQIGAWFNPRYGDDARTEFVIQAEKLGYPTAWLGFGLASIGDLSLVERVLDATTTITVATAIVNMWTNDSADIARAGASHPDTVTASCWGSASAILNPSRPTAGPTQPWSTTSTNSTPVASLPIDASSPRSAPVHCS